MKKRIIAVITSLSIIIASVVGFGAINAFGATSGDCSADGASVKWSYSALTKTLSITGTGDMKSYVAATAVPWRSFKPDCTTIKVGEGVTAIGVLAFYGFSNVTSVTLPSTLKVIKGGSLNYGAFRECTSIESIVLPEGLTEIDDLAFRDCTSLKSITIPDSVTTLGIGVFRGCTNLQTVRYGTGLTSTGVEAFYDAGVKYLTLSSSIEKIDTYSFFNCNIIDLVIPENVTSIGTRSFANNYNLLTVLVHNPNCVFEGISIAEEDPFYGATQISNQTIVFKGHSGSTTETYVNEHPHSTYVFESIDSCAHTNKHEVITLNPTCTQKGTTTQVCDKCGFVVSTSELEATGHNWQVTSTVDQSGENGHITTNSICLNCNEEKQEIEHVGWVKGYYDYENTATCDKSGYEKYHCTYPNCTQRDRIVPALAQHKVNSYNVTVAPTCTEKGEQQGTCTVCGITVTQEVAALGHSFIDDSVEDKIALDGHNYLTKRCERCNVTETTPEHQEWIEDYYTSTIREATSCSRSGLRLDTCTICSKTRLVTIPPTNDHDWYITARREPTCTADGSIAYACHNCTATKSESIEKTGHTLVLDQSVSLAPTCTTEGYNISKCSVCGYSQKDILKALGHTVDELNYTIITDPTCEENGEATSVCTVCQTEFSITLNALGHNYESVVTPIAEKPGHSLVSSICTRCKYLSGSSTQHDEWVDGNYSTRVVTAGSCTVPTTTQDTCNHCSETRVNTVPAPGHSYVFTGVTESNRLTYICSACDNQASASAVTVKAAWSSTYINTKPGDTRLGYQFDVINDGILNAKDYAYLVQLSKK